MRLRNYDKNLYIEGADIHEPFLKVVKKYNIYDKIQNEDVSKMILHQNKKFDLALGIGVLAHLEKNEGRFFISQLERVSKHHIITAPTGYIHNHKSLQNDSEIDSLKHKSTWNYKDFKGYNIRGFHYKGSSGGALIDTWLYAPLFTMSAINPIFTKLTQYLVCWK